MKDNKNTDAEYRFSDDKDTDTLPEQEIIDLLDMVKGPEFPQYSLKKQEQTDFNNSEHVGFTYKNKEIKSDVDYNEEELVDSIGISIENNNNIKSYIANYLKPEKIDAVSERIIKDLVAQKIEKMLVNVIENAVLNEIKKLREQIMSHEV